MYRYFYSHNCMISLVVLTESPLNERNARQTADVPEMTIQPPLMAPSNQRAAPMTQAESISRHIENAIHKELLSLKDEKTSLTSDDRQSAAGALPLIPRQVQDVFESVAAAATSTASTTTSPLLPNAFPVATSALSQQEQQLLSANVSAVQHLNPTIASRLSQPIKTESPATAQTPPASAPISAESLAANVNNQISAYLMAANSLSSVPSAAGALPTAAGALPLLPMPFGMNPMAVMTPQMQEELRQHIMFMQTYAAQAREQQETAAGQLQESKQQLSSVEAQLAQLNNQYVTTAQKYGGLFPAVLGSSQQQHSDNRAASPAAADDQQHLSSNNAAADALMAAAHTQSQQSESFRAQRSNSGSGNDVMDTHDMAPSPVGSDDAAYPKSETPKFKSTLLQRYLQGDRTLFGSMDPSLSFDVLPPTSATSVPTTQQQESMAAAVAAQSSFSPLDLRKRIRNLSGSMGSQDYEDISDDGGETDATSSGSLLSPGAHMKSSRSVSVNDSGCVNDTPSSATSSASSAEPGESPHGVFDDLAKRWREVNYGATPTKK